MTIKNACFISYPHSRQGQSNQNFVKQLVKSLQHSIGYEVVEGIYLDSARLEPGYIWNDALAQAICESACMIVLYTPLYPMSDYCLREFVAMEQIEEERKELLGNKYDRIKRMIIPLVIPGFSPLPEKITNIQYEDVSSFKLKPIDTNKYKKARELIEKISEQILYNLEITKEINDHEKLSECDKFKVPDIKKAYDSWGISKPVDSPTDPFPK